MKKIALLDHLPQKRQVVKILLLMKLVMFLLTVVCLQAYSKGISQEKISISVEKKNLKEVLAIIQQKSAYRILYNDNIVGNDWQVTLSLKDANVAEVLEKVLANTSLNYKLLDNNLIVISQSAYVARNVIKGSVADDKGNPLAGVSVTIKNSQRGVVSSADGLFSIEADKGDILEFSLIGHKTVTIEIKNDNDLAVTLAQEAASLNDIIVVGYGTQKKGDLTGSVGVVKTEQALKSRPATNVQELFAGSVPGLNVTKSSGAVGSGGSLNIRGVSTIGGSSGVLVLIDGTPGNIYTLNPNDIESVSVLKDAASAAIYGSRAANGVLLITTKTGKGVINSKPVVEVASSVGLQSPQFRLDFVGAADYMKLWDQALVNDGKDPLYGEQGLADLKAGKYADNKWYKEIYKKSTIINNNYMSVSGKADYITYRISGSYDYQDGTLPNNNYNRYIIRPDLSIKLAKNLTLGANVQYTETKINQPQGGTEIWQTQSARVSPISFIYNKQGQYGAGSAMAGNPIAGVNEGGYNLQKVKELLNIFDLTYTPVKNLNLKGSFSSYSFDSRTTNKVNTYNLYNDDGTIYSVQNQVNSLSEASGNNRRNMLQLTADYGVQVNRHSIKALVGYSQEYYKQTSFSASRDNMPFDGIDVLDVGIANKQNNGTASDVAIQSVFGRINYDYDGKYLLQVNARGDGSSRFAPGHRWGYFPSFSAGWNMHREKFLSDVKWLSQLKLRASWGTLGDAEKVAYYPTAAVLAFSPNIYAFNGAIVPGAWNNVAVNPNITWEKAEVTNFGVDAGFFKQKLQVTVEYFINKRSNILYQAPVPTEFGLPAPLSNLLKMQNKGLDASVSYNDRSGNFYWGIDANASFSRNKVLDLHGTGPWIGGSTYTAEGLPYNLPYGLQAVGLFQSDADVAKNPSQGTNVFAGNIQYKNQNGDNQIDGSDRIILNKNVVPINYGSNLSFGWKNIDLSMNLYGVYNQYRYMQGYEGWAFYLSQNARPMHMDAWTPQNPNASYPRLSIQYTSNDTKYSSYWLRKASYLKLQNLQVGYTLPRQVLSKMHVNYVRFYVSAQNLATLTNYPGFDPEGNYYPISRTVSFGVNLKF
ncbi:TonB-dependent receptor [Danxiaibacter flavus]|uniref:TonB-dependent receptor n=1 Tax=Danxiaibacter flavus TaxID=3049108 RepID=A0ABV3ZB82_9BACT|nr:TonB-dependent receptor [Chitinophagaceae bacterium DXS]